MASSALLASSEFDADSLMRLAAHENFPVALGFLPRQTRQDLHAIYGFARLADQIGDEAAGDRSALLDVLERDLDCVYAAHGTPEHPILLGLADTIHRCEIPATPFRHLIEANRFDQRGVSIASAQALLDYCALSANPVGELVLRVFGQWSERVAKSSDAVCSALQIVEHCQDVAEDFANGRVYLPDEDLDACDCDRQRLAERPAPLALRRVIARQVSRARDLLDEAIPLVSRLRGWARPAVAAFAAGGLATSSALEGASFDPNSKPLRPHKGRILVSTLGLLIRARRTS